MSARSRPVRRCLVPVRVATETRGRALKAPAPAVEGFPSSDYCVTRPSFREGKIFFSPGKDFLDLVAQVFCLERLGEISVCPAKPGLVRVAFGGNHDDRDLRILRVFAYLLCELGPVHGGHVPIGENQAKGLLAKPVERGMTIMDLINVGISDLAHELADDGRHRAGV